MEATMLLGGLGVALAFAAVFVLSSNACVLLGRVPGGAVLTQSSNSLLRVRFAWRLRNGYASLLPVAAVLLRNARVDTLAFEGAQLCSERGYVTTERALVTVAVMGSLVLSLVAGLISQSVAGAIAVAICALAVAVVVVRTASDRRRDSVREAVPEVLRAMGACFEAGFTLQQTFLQVASETKGTLHVRFAHAAHVLETGGGASEALSEFKQSKDTADLAFIAVALDVQHQAGGSLKQVLDAARDAVEGELALRRSLKVQTAQARLSARVVSVMPFALIAVFSLVSNDFLAPFFASPAGYGLLAVALGMQAAGIGLVRRVLAVGATS